MNYYCNCIQVQAERFDEAFETKYFGTCHNTGIRFHDACRWATVEKGGMILPIRPGEWLVKWPDNTYAVFCDESFQRFFWQA